MRANISDIRRLAEKVQSNWNIMGFPPYQSCEAEVLIAQTIQAANNNHKTHGKSFSFLSSNAKVNSYGHHKNGTALDKLIEDEMFEVTTEDVDGEKREVIYPTHTLVEAIDNYFENKYKK